MTTWVNASAVDAALSQASKKVDSAAAKFGPLRVSCNRKCGEDDVEKAEKILRLASDLLKTMEDLSGKRP